MRMPPSAKLPDGIKTVSTSYEDDKNKDQPVKPGNEEGGKTMAKNLEELRAENPDLAAQVMEEAKASISEETETAVKQERKRIAAIDEIAALYSDDLVKEAKYGKNPCTAQELAFRAAKEAAQKGRQFVQELGEDYKASNADNIEASPAEDDDPKPLTGEELMAQGRAHARKMQQKEEE